MTRAKRTRRWYVFLPGEVYANGPFEACGLRAARQWVRDWRKFKRLPRGTQIWLAK